MQIPGPTPGILQQNPGGRVGAAFNKGPPGDSIGPQCPGWLAQVIRVGHTTCFCVISFLSMRRKTPFPLLEYYLSSVFLVDSLV